MVRKVKQMIVSYIRTSTDKQQNSIDTQIQTIEKYCDYKEFRNILKKIDIMPIIHSSDEINKVTSGTMYSCTSNEIPLVIPSGTLFMNKVLKYKSFEKAKNLSEFADKLIKISKK